MFDSKTESVSADTYRYMHSNHRTSTPDSATAQGWTHRYCVPRWLAPGAIPRHSDATRRSLKRGPRENILTAREEQVGLMTRAAASQIKPSAAHGPPPFPTVLTLKPMLLMSI